MTTPAKPLTADEIAAIKNEYMVGDSLTTLRIQRLIATIEQQAQQIEKLRKALEYCAVAPGELNLANQAQFMVAREALATTEPKP